MKHIQHRITGVEPGSIGEELEIVPGDCLISIGGREIADIFDYRFFVEGEEYLEVLIRRQDGEEWLLEVDKEPWEDLGLVFENGLMDDYRSCCNKCIFCFIDQMPPGMRETLYFKDDDARLSFLQGNYVTLTNLSEQDIDRIIRYRLEPVNISFQTTNPALRCKMLNNRFAGEALKKADRLYEAGISMNGQVVLCKGINDKEELTRTITDLGRYAPCLQSVSVVPAGLTKYREGLSPLELFDREEARQVLAQIHGFQQMFMEQYGIHFVHAGDEWYPLAGEALPPAESYDGYLQLENGVGMLRSLLDEFEEALSGELPHMTGTFECAIATGRLAAPYIKEMTERLMARCPGLTVYVYPIVNEFFGESITVSGLLTGQDIVKQLKGRWLGERLLLPENVLRSGEDVLLDDMTLKELQGALQVKTDIVKSSGADFIRAVCGRTGE